MIKEIQDFLSVVSLALAGQLPPRFYMAGFALCVFSLGGDFFRWLVRPDVFGVFFCGVDLFFAAWFLIMFEKRVARGTDS